MKRYAMFSLIVVWILVLKGVVPGAEENKTQEFILISSLMMPEGTAANDRTDSLWVKLVGLGADGLEFRVEKKPVDKSMESSESCTETFKVQKISIAKNIKVYHAGKEGMEFVLEYDVPFPHEPPDPLPWELEFRGVRYKTVGKVERSPLFNASDKSLSLSVAGPSHTEQGEGVNQFELIVYLDPLVIDKNTVKIEHSPDISRFNASFTVKSDIPTEQVLSMIRLWDITLEIKTQDRVRFMKKLRSEPGTFSNEEIGRIIRERNFRDTNWGNNPDGDFPNEYEAQTLQGDKVIIDHTSGLMWQQDGSSENMTEIQAQHYIDELNKKPYAGYSDWRLPTIEELASLIEPKETKGSFISPIFDIKGSWYGSSDKIKTTFESDQTPWGVSFASGYVIGGGYGNGYIRAVRTQLGP